MKKIAFSAQDFEGLQYVEVFNEAHWKGTLHGLGWRYDINREDPQIAGIKESLRQIQKKMDLLRSSFVADPRFRAFKSSVQKITLGMTNRYLSHLWFSFTNKVEQKPPNEPQLQVVLTPTWLDVSLWYENGHAVTKYFQKLLATRSAELKADGLLTFEVCEEGSQSNMVGTYSCLEWEDFVGQVRKLDWKCKVGLHYRIKKDVVIAEGENIEGLIGGYLARLLPLFDLSGSVGERFIIAHIEWNDEGWTAPQIPDKPAFKYVQDGNVPHDSLTFKSDKPIDTRERIYGYFQPGWGSPSQFMKARPGTRYIFFMSKKKIVGVYGDAEFLKEPIGYDHAEFEKERYLANISGNKAYSLGFLKKCYLDVIPEYMNEKNIGQSNFVYIAEKNANRILQDVRERYERVLITDPNNAIAREHLEKLRKISSGLSAVGEELITAEQGVLGLVLAKRQIILYGPPGTGKTFVTKRLSVRIIGMNRQQCDERQ